MTSPQPAHRPNTITFDEVMEAADLLGAQAGNGKDVLIKSLLKCFEGANHGVLDTKKNKHGNDCDDATKFSERYFKARNSNVVWDPKADSAQKLASTVRTAIKLGSSPKWDACGPVNDLMYMFQQERKKGTKLDSADNVFLKYARAQLAADILMEKEELEQFLYKKASAEKTLEEYLEAQAKKLDKLILGEAPGNLQCKSQHIYTARHAIRQELAALATAKKKGTV